MRREIVARIGLALCLSIPLAAGVACDREDERDIQEGVNDADKQIDKLDNDGKDD